MLAKSRSLLLKNGFIFANRIKSNAINKDYFKTKILVFVHTRMIKDLFILVDCVTLMF